MTHLFTVLFFATVLGTALAALWAVIADNLDAVLANLPWKPRLPGPDGGAPVYWATPSISSNTPIRASTVSPATAR